MDKVSQGVQGTIHTYLVVSMFGNQRLFAEQKELTAPKRAWEEEGQLFLTLDKTC